MTDSIFLKGKEVPTDLLISIFSYLEPIDLAKCSSVSKTFQKISNLDILWTILYQNIHILKPNEKPKDSFIKRTISDRLWFGSEPTISTIQTKSTNVNTILYKKDYLSKGKGLMACGLNNNTIELYTVNGKDIKLSKIFEDKLNG